MTQTKAFGNVCSTAMSMEALAETARSKDVDFIFADKRRQIRYIQLLLLMLIMLMMTMLLLLLLFLSDPISTTLIDEDLWR